MSDDARMYTRGRGQPEEPLLLGADLLAAFADHSRVRGGQPTAGSGCRGRCQPHDDPLFGIARKR
ncbi:hypothetical protein [Streptomyces kaempferi]|uniref:Uncharacterized protein n=1 Tax=Streptomyces kaempferi TaxID=333725 RepID=A0ABW3XVR6_9ACTN